MDRDNTNEESSSNKFNIGSPKTKNSNNQKPAKNEKFYVHKRGLFRKAD